MPCNYASYTGAVLYSAIALPMAPVNMDPRHDAVDVLNKFIGTFLIMCRYKNPHSLDSASTVLVFIPHTISPWLIPFILRTCGTLDDEA